MTIWLDQNSKVLVQGMTGSEGRKHTQRMISSGTRVVGGVTPGKGGQTVTFEEDPVKVYDSAKDIDEQSARYARLELAVDTAVTARTIPTVPPHPIVSLSFEAASYNQQNFDLQAVILSNKLAISSLSHQHQVHSFFFLCFLLAFCSQIPLQKV